MRVPGGDGEGRCRCRGRPQARSHHHHHPIIVLSQSSSNHLTWRISPVWIPHHVSQPRVTKESMETRRLLLEVEVEGRIRSVSFPRNAGFEAIKSVLAREFAPKSLVGVSYLSDGKFVDIDSVASLEGYLRHDPLPPLKVAISSVAASPPAPTLRGTSDKVKQTPTKPPSGGSGMMAPPKPLPDFAGLVDIPPERLFDVLLAASATQTDSSGGQSAVRREKIRRLAVYLAAPPEALLASPLLSTFLSEIAALVDESSRAAFLLGRAGVDLSVVRLLKAFDRPPSRPEDALLFGAIICLSLAPRNRTSMVLAGVVPPLVRMLVANPNLHITNPVTAKFLLQAIAAIANGEPVLSESFVKAGAAAPLVGLLAAHPDLPATGPEVAEALLDAIGVLTWDPENATAFGQAGVAAPLARMLTAHPDLHAAHPGVAVSLLTAIGNMAEVAEIRTALVSAGVVGPLVRLLGADHLTPNISNQLLDAIDSISGDPASIAALIRAGVVDPLIRLLPRLPTPDSVVAEPLLRVVAALAGDPAGRASFAAARPHLERFLGCPGVDPRLAAAVRIMLKDA
ncbi:hypothetical protein PAPYR_7052 [Paratrimastix pyriformis]|uniref:Uncharacterized protein n=1 Tax=Paratrimastix pyriformis TaxID=342808 RepID=A0ABQ8UFC9_9EUKA|nr:hypothetical protein PAPYR_7052 [Paratrimastix pyriformis]